MTKAKPPIDKTAETAQVVGDPPAAPTEPAEPGMPTAENSPACLFKPGNGITTTDVVEIALMYLLQLTNSDAQFAPGALRTIPLQATRVGLLSESARQWMKPVAPDPSIA